MMRQFKVVRKPARCGLTNKMIKPGGVVTCPDDHWYRILNHAGVLGEEIIETAMMKPNVRTAVAPSAKMPKHVGGGWYEMPDGNRVQGKENALKQMGGGD